MASFSTVSLMREKPEIIRRFVDYYRAAGASRIVIYWDGPILGLAFDAPDIVVIGCDDAFWSGLCGARPPGLEDRQFAVYKDVLTRCHSDWLLVIDADEYVFGDRMISTFLDEIPATADAVSIPTAEAVWGPGDDIDIPFGSTHFRLKWQSERLWEYLQKPIYGDVARHMQQGLTGHINGKEFLRTDRSYSWIRNHSALRDGIDITRPAASLKPSLEGMFLGHYDSISLARWTEKWRQRIAKDTIARNMTDLRISQMDLVSERMRRGDSDIRALFAAFYGLSKAQYAALSLLGYAFRKDIFARSWST